MERKTFLKTLVWGSAAVCLGACASAKTSSSVNGPVKIDLNDPIFAALKEKNGFVIYQGMILINIGAEKPVVLSAACPHMGKKVVWDASIGAVRCPAHNSRFDTNGNVLKGPARENLETYSVSKESNLLTISKL